MAAIEYTEILYSTIKSQRLVLFESKLTHILLGGSSYQYSSLYSVGQTKGGSSYNLDTQCVPAVPLGTTMLSLVLVSQFE